MKKNKFAKYIIPFKYHFNNDPKYISNGEIEKYFTDNNMKNNFDAIYTFIEYYSEIGVNRFILREYLKDLSFQLEDLVPQLAY